MSVSGRIRWGDNDRYFGPFTYSRGNWRPFRMVLGSGDGDENPGCRLLVSAFGRTLITALPAIVRPWRRKVDAKTWDAATVERLGRDWYWDMHEREYGFCVSDGHLSVYYGRQTDDSSTEQRWGCFLPWTQWRHVRHSFYGLNGECFESVSGKDRYEVYKPIRDACPTVTFAFTDFDGEELTATTRIEEREWLRGQGWFKWLSWFYRPKIHRSLDISFSGETGDRKGSWKGGTTGHSIEMLPGELHEAAFRRYCDGHNMTFTGAAG